MNLSHWGWNDRLAMDFADYAAGGCCAGRVVSVSREIYRVITAQGECSAALSGKLRFRAGSRSELPAVGDWVALSIPPSGRAAIAGILPRRSKFSRKAAGAVVEEQVIAANIDYVFLLNALNQDYNLRRLERYLVLAWESGARPVVLLTKAGLCADAAQKMAETAAVAAGAPVYLVSSVTGTGLSGLEQYLKAGLTVTLLGSSGAGKSTLLNRLAGCELQRIGAIRSGDDRGRHTTTRSDLFRLPGGALVIDTPGLRELQLWGGGSGLSETFEDLEAYAARCRFNDCRHRDEPGCAVQEALRSGALDRGRYESYLKLQREMAYLERTRNRRAQMEEQARWKAISKAIRKYYKNKPAGEPLPAAGCSYGNMRSVWLRGCLKRAAPRLQPELIAVILKAKLKELLIGRKAFG